MEELRAKDRAAIRRALGAGGRLAQVAPSFEERPQQIAMAEQVLDALRHDSRLLAEAGTGTGKTLAYLLPAYLSGKKVVISTATKTLQDQIFFKDLPLLARAVGAKIPAAYMKGRGNYLCLERYDDFALAPKFPNREEASHWPVIEAWAARTETGDRAELELPENFATWRELSSTGETCLGQKCPQWESCHVTEMRRKAQEARIVVVNHHLFFADLALRSKGEEGVEVIPRYDAVIFDEAHALEDVATGHFGVRVSTYRLQELVTDARRAAAKQAALQSLLEPLIDAVEGRAAGFFSSLEEASGLLFTQGRGRGDGVVRLAPGSLDGVAHQREELLLALEELSDATEEEEPALEAIARRCRGLGEEIDRVTTIEEGAPFVHFAERRGRGLFVEASPIEVAGELARRLWGGLSAAVLTSATLAVGGRFEHLRRRLGLGGEVAELTVDSPFDHRSQSALYLPRHLPEPNDPSFVEHLALEVEKLVAITGGRAFVLCTSVRNMVQAWELLEPRLPYRVLLQGQLPKAQLVERFQEQPSVLFATASFWEGVDVPGEALSLVIIDKIPFASPGDPVVGARIDALRSRNIDPFSAYQIPQAAIGLRQGFGRLLRSKDDRGIVAILDRRIVTRGYGRQFLRALPDASKFGALEHVARWWERG